MVRARDEHLLLIVLHHIASDGWSVGLLIREVTTLYDALRQGLRSPIAPLRVQYADFAIWQRQWLTGAVLDAQLSYWRKQLESFTPLRLPTDASRAEPSTRRGGHVSLTLDTAMTAALHECGRQEGVTLFMVLLAAFQVLLYRYTGQDEVVVGSPIADRRRPEIEGLIGFFVNTLVLRTDTSGNPSFRELIGRVRAENLLAYGHQDLPFDQLVEELAPTRDLSHNPLVQVFFQLFQPAERQIGLNLSGVEVTALPEESVATRFDLELHLVESGSGGFEAELLYAVDLFDESTMWRFAEHYRQVLGPPAPL